MANETASKPSFSAGQRWSIFFSVNISIIAVFALLIMVNYLAARYYVRFPWSIQTRTELSPQTVNLLKTLTNNIDVVVYYNKNDVLFEQIKDLLKEYQVLNPKISVRMVDYLDDPGEATRVKEAYADFLDPLVDTNAVIFASAIRTNVVSSEKLGQFVIEPVASQGEQREFRKKLTSFMGEECFTEAIFSVMNNRSARAYFLEAPDSIHRLNGANFNDYQKFKSLLQNINVDVTALPSLLGSNGVPADCKLLIIAAPSILAHEEVENVARYLDHGGRLLVLFNYNSRRINTQLEPLLAKWGIKVGHDVVHDPDNSYGSSGDVVVVRSFNKNHAAIGHLAGYALELVLPRSVGVISKSQDPDAAAAQELAWTGSRATTDNSPVAAGKPIPVVAAVEKGDVKGITDQGTTRIVAVGDSYLFDNQLLGEGAAKNRAFASYAVNWLVGQTQMLLGVAPRTVPDYTIMMTPQEAQNIRWIFLAGMPGGILLFGGLVWLRRRR